MDFPFKVGDKVSVVSPRHGAFLYDGEILAIDRVEAQAAVSRQGFGKPDIFIVDFEFIEKPEVINHG